MSIDPAYMAFARVIEELMGFGEIVDEAAGVRSYVTACEIETPVELTLARDADGRLVIGSTPPLYPLRTSVEPSYHRMRFTASLSRTSDG